MHPFIVHRAKLIFRTIVQAPFALRVLLFYVRQLVTIVYMQVSGQGKSEG